MQVPLLHKEASSFNIESQLRCVFVCFVNVYMFIQGAF